MEIRWNFKLKFELIGLSTFLRKILIYFTKCFMCCTKGFGSWPFSIKSVYLVFTIGIPRSLGLIRWGRRSKNEIFWERHFFKKLCFSNFACRSAKTICRWILVTYRKHFDVTYTYKNIFMYMILRLSGEEMRYRQSQEMYLEIPTISWCKGKLILFTFKVLEMYNFEAISWVF